MSRRLEQTLMTWMRQQAAEAGQGSDPEGVVRGAISRARRIRRRRTIASGAVAAVVLVSAIPTGAAAVGWFRDAQRSDVTAAAPTTETPSTEPTSEPSRPEKKDGRTENGPARITLDFDELPEGTTDAPWWEAASGTVHAGDETFPMAQPWSFAPVAGGSYALVTALDDGGRRLAIVGPDGEQPLAEVSPEDEFARPVISADGRTLAWSDTASGDGTTLHLATAEGEEVASTHLAGRYGISVAGFLGDRVVVTSSDDGTVEVWDPSSNGLTELPGRPDAVRAWATNPASELASVATRLVEDDATVPHWCNAVVDTREAAVLWESCELTPIGFSPDGTYAVAQPSNTEGAGPGSYTVVGAESGRPVLEVQADLLVGFTWEDDNRHVVLRAYVGGETALVRCSVDGVCERVTEPVASDFPADPEPYVLSYR